MANYSKEEIKAFESKDLRINRCAILKSILENQMTMEEKSKHEEICKLADKYVDYIYEGLSCDKKDEPVVCSDKAVLEINWKQEAESVNIPIPNSKNIEILLHILEEYKKNNNGAEIRTDDLLHTVYRKYNKYPTNKASTSKILELF